MKIGAFIFALLDVIALALVGIIFAAIGVYVGLIALIPLVWILPMTIKMFRYSRGTTTCGVGFKICTLLVVNLISGILLLCADD